MVLFTWTDDLSVKVNEIDEQHKKLISLINNLHDAMLEKRGKQALENTLQELASYTVYHFQTEEKYMQKFNYPAYASHKIQHDAFVKKVSDFQKDFQANKLGLSIELMKFLRDWVSNHIKQIDQQYSGTFIQNGLK